MVDTHAASTDSACMAIPSFSQRSPTPKIEYERETKKVAKNGDRIHSRRSLRVSRSSLVARLVATIVALLVVDIMRGAGAVTAIVEWLQRVVG